MKAEVKFMVTANLIVLGLMAGIEVNSIKEMTFICAIAGLFSCLVVYMLINRKG